MKLRKDATENAGETIIGYIDSIYITAAGNYVLRINQIVDMSIQTIMSLAEPKLIDVSQIESMQHRYLGTRDNFTMAEYRQKMLQAHKSFNEFNIKLRGKFFTFRDYELLKIICDDSIAVFGHIVSMTPEGLLVIGEVSCADLSYIGTRNIDPATIRIICRQQYILVNQPRSQRSTTGKLIPNRNKLASKPTEAKVDTPTTSETPDEKVDDTSPKE